MQALFLEGCAGTLFAIYHPARPRRRVKLGLVYLPPFAEEMNRSRRMASLQAGRLAALGIDVLLLDPFGTGDSAGDFGDARWEIWREDAKTAIAWLKERSGARVGLWGLRLGALLAAEVTSEAAQPPACLLLWQPILSGDRFLTQFLRLRVAAGMDKSSEAETTKELRARLWQGEALEIAGYELASPLARAIAERQLAGMLQRPEELPLDVLEVRAGDDPAVALSTRQLLEELGNRKRRLRAHAVSGDPFWSLQEITVAPKLLEATEALFRA
ncbi:hydrolase 2, exosortase A system-associated [Pelagibius marinus]|uniref:hydrolase 2, exosortase A system-associated n=1 Tax=Pelagibius marinus TaxID=2762760 RepID=UPI001872A4A2|nr:hydrolase 2, exosortase A system-associated [Pelagibius marinus]